MHRMRMRHQLWYFVGFIIAGLFFFYEGLFRIIFTNEEFVHREATEPERYQDGSKFNSAIGTVSDNSRFKHLAEENNHVRYEDVNNGNRFNVDGRDDVMVFLHIQKTSGRSFSHKMVHSLNLTQPCAFSTMSKRATDKCRNKQGHIWSNNFYSVGWPCGVHADWTELTNCVDHLWQKYEKPNPNRKFWYFTILRDPVKRYISEWKHTARGNNWDTARLACGGRTATRQEVPLCFGGWDWTGISLNKFMSCPHNLANNRQTRMLADLQLVNCYNTSTLLKEDREDIILRSAKKNLQEMAMFGLTEYHRETQLLFENTFQVTFTEELAQNDSTRANAFNLLQEQKKRIMQLNRLDIELYKFAKAVFLERVAKFHS